MAAKTPTYREFDESAYRIRILAGIVLVQMLFLALVHFWPAQEKKVEQAEEMVFYDDVVIEDVEITRQSSTPPPPPRPQLPEPVPNDEIIEDDLVYDESLDLLDLPELPYEEGTGRTGDEDIIVGNPQLPPTVVKIVEPHVPNLPSELKGRIEMLVNFLVDTNGRVEEASIVQIRKYDEDMEEYEVVPFIQYGLIDATIEAALQWQFRPARHQGSGVKAYTTHRFNY